MEKKSTFIVMAIAIVLSSIFAIEGNKLGVLLSLWSGVSSMIIFHYMENRGSSKMVSEVETNTFAEVATS